MRLLHFDALERLVSTDFRGKTIPPYAILSHRWGDSEILLEDITSGAYKDKQEGYRKLQFCAKQAAQDELQYFWIDTCCIDRWNLRERSRAINSMFLWYKNAERCYVFLSDVSTATTTETPQRSDWESSFRASAWFSRGWTLQELIAPVSVEFFSCEGRRIGDKTSLDQLIHEITDIPLAALRNCPLDQFTTLERERWAAYRRTTEEEDMIYCLLGVLGISMPTAYGEGQERTKRVLGDEHPDTLTSMSILALTYREQGRWKEAEELQVQAMQTTKRVLGEEHPHTLTSMSNLGLTYRNQGRWKEAEELQVQAMQTRKRMLGDEHPDTITSMHNLAFTLQSQARYEDALALMERCYRLREQILGKQHSDTQSSLDTLSDWRADCSDESP